MFRPNAGGELLGRLDRRLPEAAAAQGGEEDVLVAPHHALRRTGGPARVEDVEVVTGPGQRRPFGARPGECVFVRRGVAAVGVAAVLEHDDVTKPRELGLDLAEERQERALDDGGFDVGVLEDVAQLVGDVPVVDVDRDEPGFERPEERLDPLGAVPAVDRHLRTGFETQTEQVVGEAVRALVELRERPARRAGHERLAVRHSVDDDLEEIGEVERRHLGPPALGRKPARGAGFVTQRGVKARRRHSSIRVLSRCVVSIHSSTISKMTSFVGRTVFSRPTI